MSALHAAMVRRKGRGILAGMPNLPLFLRLVLAFALLLGLVGVIGNGTEAFAQGTGGATLAPQSAGWWARASHVIIHPWVTIALLVAGCSLLYHDLLTPLTWGATGTLGVLCVGSVFAAQVTVGGAAYLGVLLLLAGLALLLLEIHVYPGHGSALAGFVLMYVGMFLSLGGMRNAGFALGVTTALIVVAGLAFLAYLPKSPAWQRVGQQMAFHGSPLAAQESATRLLGRTGTVVTFLHPRGMAEIDGVQMSVVTEGDFLDPGASIIVTEVDGDRIVVEGVNRTASVAA